MEENFRFLYKKEFWYVSAFINTNQFVGETKAEEIERLLLDRLRNIQEHEMKKPFRYLEKYDHAEDKKRILIEMARNISIECDWEPYFQNFPYTDENNPYTEDGKDLVYNTLGFFKLEVEYFKDDSYKKEKITPDLLQQIPFLVSDILKDYSTKKENEFLLLDTQSPIYIFVISTKTTPVEVQWNEENIDKYKRELGYWTQIHAGQWPDYSDDLFRRRVKKNLTNRLSELYYIKRNSGFIYMTERNYETEFNFVKEYIIEPTPAIRSVLFALMTINNSLDALFMKRYSLLNFMTVERIEQKIKNLRFLRGMIQTKMSLIYSTLDWNPRQLYTRVLTHLIRKFRIEEIVRRTNEKFQMLYDSMQELYLKRNEETQKRTKKAIYFLNIIFSLGFVIDFANAVRTASRIAEIDERNIILHRFLSIILGIAVVVTLIYFAYSRFKLKESKHANTVDAVIQDNNQNIILVKRRYAPYKGRYALPGGFIKFNEEPEQAVIREVREETNLAVKIVEKIGVYDQKGRDPRGRIISTAFKCRLIKDLSKMKGGDDAIATEAISIDKLKTMDLAFDHKQILKDAGIL